MANPAQSSGLEGTGLRFEGFRPALAKPEIDPLSLVVVAGLANGGAIATSPVGPETLLALQGIPSSSSMFADAQAAIPLVQAHVDSVLGGGPAGFGQMVEAAHAHTSVVQEIADKISGMASTAFEDLGSGITSMSSMITQGLDGVMGSLPAVASMITAAGPIFNMANMGSFGTAGGFALSLISNKFGNASGLVPQLESMGISKEMIGDPLYEGQVKQAMSRIKDPVLLAEIADQYGVPVSSISNMGDFLNLGGSPVGASCSLAGIGEKFGDMGAMFKSPSDAATLLNTLTIPSLPNLDSAASDLGSFMGNIGGMMGPLTGVASGIPPIGDFFPIAIGNSAMDTFLGGATSGGIQDVVASLAPSTNLFAAAGIPLGVPPTVNLQSVLGFATGGLSTIGTSSLPDAKNLLSTMATPDEFGDALKGKMDAAANAKKMADLGGIPPLKFV